MKKIIYLTALFIVFSCKSGEDYQKPKLDSLEEIASRANSSDEEYNQKWWSEIEDFKLKTLIEIAQTQNFDVKIQESLIENYLAQLGIAKNALLPDVEINASTTKNRLSLQGLQGLNPFVKKNYQQNDIGIHLAWRIDLFGGLQRQIEAAKSIVEAQNFQLQDLRNSIATQLSLEYILYCSLLEKLDLLNKKIINQQKIINLKREKFRAGISSQNSLNQERISLNKIHSQIPQIKSQMALSLLRIDLLISQKAGTSKEIIADEKIKIPDFSKIYHKKISSKIIEKNPKILQKEQDLIAANANIGVAKSSYFPKFTFSADYGISSIQDKNILSSRAQNFIIGPFISWRILDFMKIDDEILAAKADKKRALESYKQAVFEVLLKIEISSEKIKQNQKQFVFNKKEIDLINENLAINKSLFEGGVSDYFQVAMSKEEFYNAQNELIELRKNRAEFLIEFIDAVY